MFVSLHLLIMGLILTGVLCYIGFSVGYLLERNYYIVGIFYTHLFMLIAVFVLHHGYTILKMFRKPVQQNTRYQEADYNGNPYTNGDVYNNSNPYTNGGAYNKAQNLKMPNKANVNKNTNIAINRKTNVTANRSTNATTNRSTNVTANRSTNMTANRSTNMAINRNANVPTNRNTNKHTSNNR
jgi:phosphotransferase system  glucose/maltose/N-acetylglucosamine-specific IIC component